MSSLPKPLEARAMEVSFTPESMRVVLTDGREITVPLVWFPRLWRATPEQRAAWEFIGPGVGIHWEEIDEDISVPQLLGLPCE